MTTPRVSVILPTYNRAHVVRDAVESVLSQTYADFELIVVDDGSTDHTGDVVGQYSDQRIRYVRKRNAGLAAARNTGISCAKGEYVCFLDDDDLYLPHKLEVQIQFMDEHPHVGWTSGGVAVTDMDGHILSEWRKWTTHPDLGLKTWLFGCPTAVHAVMVRREWLECVDGFAECLPQAEDWDMWLRLSAAECRMAWVKSIVCSYRLHSGNMVRNARKQTRGTIAVLDRFFWDPKLSLDLADLRDKAYAHAYLVGACREYGVRDTDIAKAHLELAIQNDPGMLGDRGTPILEMVAAWAWNPLTPDPFEYVRYVLQNLPPAALELAEMQRRAIAMVAMRRAFRAKSACEWNVLRRMLLIALVNDPTWLSNLGVISILVEAVIGTKASRWVKAQISRVMKGDINASC